MNVGIAEILAAAGVGLVASAAFFFVGRKAGTSAEVTRLAAAKATHHEAEAVAGGRVRERVFRQPGPH